MGHAPFGSRVLAPLCLRIVAGALAFLLSSTGPAEAAANVVEYTYDAAGNITQVRRQAATGFAITSVDPESGAVGATVTIYGTGTERLTGSYASPQAAPSPDGSSPPRSRTWNSTTSRGASPRSPRARAL